MSGPFFMMMRGVLGGAPFASSAAAVLFALLERWSAEHDPPRGFCGSAGPAPFREPRDPIDKVVFRHLSLHEKLFRVYAILTFFASGFLR